MTQSKRFDIKGDVTQGVDWLSTYQKVGGLITRLHASLQFRSDEQLAPYPLLSVCECVSEFT